ncbi:chromosomal replication initiator protein DnaA [bacterium]|nr:chromosomal replication initiator protein DnaA [bacterium]
MENSDHEQIWAQCLEIIQDNVNPQSFHTWFKPLVPVKFEQQKLTLNVPSQFFYEWIEQHYPDIIRTALAQVAGEESDIFYTVLKNKNIPADEAPTVITKQKTSGPRLDAASDLNNRYIFKNFVEGSGNQFAKAASLAVAEKPGETSFNPLVIYGGVGLGKTHLTQAIGNYCLETGTAKRIRYVSSEKFTIEFINSIQNNLTTEFSQIYRNVDLLLVDDIQFFMSKERTQEEFFHTFNALHQRGKQIVLSSDRPPKELKDLEERLLSRFQWGLVADIQPPDLETRIAILQQKAHMDGLALPADIIEYMATNITSNIRELEGALIKLLAFSSLKGTDINLELAKMVLKDIVVKKKRNISIEDIQRVVCDYYSIPDDLLRGKSRKKEIVFARQMAMYMAKELTSYSLKSIGLHFGGRDHSTVIHAVKSIQEALRDPSQKVKVREAVETIRKKIEIASL